MRKIKIVHTGDLHFDTPFRDVGEKQSKKNKEELKEVFSKVIHFCKNESVDILLLAGDIFDNFTLNRETLHFIESSLGQIMNTRVFISPGNHDPYGHRSFYKLVKWPENVYIFKGDIEKVNIPELNINIWGAAFKEQYIRESMLKGFNYSSDKINIMIIHGELSNSSKGNEYNPITLSEIADSGMDYIALGHRHGFSGINKVGNTFYAYSGCPQGRGFDELGNKGIIYGYVSKGAVELDFVKTSKRNYEEVYVDITDAFGYEEVREKVLNSIDEELRKENLYKIILVGDISQEFNIDEDLLNEKLSSSFYYSKVIDRTGIKYDMEEISKGYSVKGLFVKKLLKKVEEAETEEEKQIIMTALKIGLSSLSELEVKRGDY